MPNKRALTLILMLCLAVAVSFPAMAEDSDSAPPLLTDPYLQDPSRSRVKVAWVTEWAGDRHLVIVGRRVGEMDEQELELVATGRESGGRGYRVIEAETIELSRMSEDSASQVPGRTYTGIERRPLWRHEGLVKGLQPRNRLP